MPIRYLLLLYCLLLIGLNQKVTAQSVATDTVYQPFEVDSMAGTWGRLQLETFQNMHLRKPFMAKVANTTGRVAIKGIVEPDGRFTNVEILRGLRPDCDQEALRVMRHFNFWKPAMKGGKPVRQAMTTAILFRANAPIYYEQGNSLTFYDENNWQADRSVAKQVIVIPVDTLTGLPTGDMRVCKVSKGVPGKELEHFAFTQQNVEPESIDDEPTVQLGHKQAEGNWVGTTYTLRTDGSLLRMASADLSTGNTTQYAPNGQVVSIVNHETKNQLTFYSGGQPKQGLRWVPGEPASNRLGDYQVTTEWDSSARITVLDGNGHSVTHRLMTSRRDVGRKTLLTEEGEYRNGEREGAWKGQTADGSYGYQERYEQGRCVGGTVTTNGQTVAYDQALKAPEFEGGVKALYTFLAENITYPVDAQRGGIMGKVYVGFTVCTDGSLCDFEVIQGVHPSLDREAMRVAKRMNKRWKPGSRRGQPIRVKYTLPVAFSLG